MKKINRLDSFRYIFISCEPQTPIRHILDEITGLTNNGAGAVPGRGDSWMGAWLVFQWRKGL